MIHSVKCNYEFFMALRDSTKTFEVRKKDRLFQVGDYLALNEFIPDKNIDPYEGCPSLRTAKDGGYTGACLLYKITYILDDPQYCKDGLVILGLARCEI